MQRAAGGTALALLPGKGAVLVLPGSQGQGKGRRWGGVALCCSFHPPDHQGHTSRCREGCVWQVPRCWPLAGQHAKLLPVVAREPEGAALGDAPSATVVLPRPPMGPSRAHQVQ
eukprot:914774-Pelagomonas_calceolata.AAC.9